VTAPRVTALAADDEARRELLDDARRVVAGDSMMLATGEMLRAAVEALDASQADVAAHGALCDARELEISELRGELQEWREYAAARDCQLAEMQQTVRTLRDESLEAERALTEAKNQLAEFQARIERLAQAIGEHVGQGAVLSVEAHRILREARATTPARPYSVGLMEARG
jgi:chromosome segregation ATPase